jgi:hypothetical protein
MTNDGIPRFSVIEHDAGLVQNAVAQNGRRGALRASRFLMPIIRWHRAVGRAATETRLCVVPVDGHSCWIYFTPESETRADRRRTQALAARRRAFFPRWTITCRSATATATGRPRATTAWELHGIGGISEQDAAIADSQGHSRSHRELLGRRPQTSCFSQMMLGAVNDQPKVEAAQRNAAHAYRLQSKRHVAPAEMKITERCARGSANSGVWGKAS